MMLHALTALVMSNARDILRRGSTYVLASVGVALILSLRWFSSFGLGYEVNQLKELGVYTIGLLGAVSVLIFCLPREDEPEEAEALLLTRPVAPWLLALGGFLGRLLPVLLLAMLWTAAIGGALWWFELADPHLFRYRGATGTLAETGTLMVPVLGQLFASAILLAFVLPLSRTRRPVVIALGAVGLYVLGYAVAGMGGIWALVLPDLMRHDLTPMLWGTAPELSLPGLLAHALAWCTAGIALDSLGLSVRSVA